MPFASALATAAAVALTGCGGGTESAPRPATVAAGEPLTVAASEYVFTPNQVTVRGGRGTVEQEIALANRGDLAHNIEVLDGERVVGRLRSFPAGDERSLTVELAPGDYEFVCTVADHAEKGMTGTIAVR